MNKRFLKALVEFDHIVVYYKNKKLFKVSNNVENAQQLLKLLSK